MEWRHETEHDGVLDTVPTVWKRWGTEGGWGASKRFQGVKLGFHSAREAAMWALELSDDARITGGSRSVRGRP